MRKILISWGKNGSILSRLIKLDVTSRASSTRPIELQCSTLHITKSHCLIPCFFILYFKANYVLAICCYMVMSYHIIQLNIKIYSNFHVKNSNFSSLSLSLCNQQLQCLGIKNIEIFSPFFSFFVFFFCIFQEKKIFIFWFCQVANMPNINTHQSNSF